MTVSIPIDIESNYTFPNRPFRENQEQISDLFDWYRENQLKRDLRSREIYILSSSYDPSGLFNLWSIKKVQEVVGASCFGKCFHFQVGSLQKIKEVTDNMDPNQKGALIFRGHSGGWKGIDGFQISQKEYLSGGNSREVLPLQGINAIIFRSCALGALWIDQKSRKLTGVAKHIAANHIGVGVTAAGGNLDASYSTKYFVHPELEILRAQFLADLEGNKNVARFFFRRKNEIYDDVSAAKKLIQEMKNSSSSRQKGRLKNVLNSSFFTCNQLFDLFLFCENDKNYEASEVFFSVYEFPKILLATIPSLSVGNKFIIEDKNRLNLILKKIFYCTYLDIKGDDQINILIEFLNFIQDDDVFLELSDHLKDIMYFLECDRFLNNNEFLKLIYRQPINFRNSCKLNIQKRFGNSKIKIQKKEFLRLVEDIENNIEEVENSILRGEVSPKIILQTFIDCFNKKKDKFCSLVKNQNYLNESILFLLKKSGFNLKNELDKIKCKLEVDRIADDFYRCTDLNNYKYLMIFFIDLNLEDRDCVLKDCFQFVFSKDFINKNSEKYFDLFKEMALIYSSRLGIKGVANAFRLYGDALKNIDMALWERINRFIVATEEVNLEKLGVVQKLPNG